VCSANLCEEELKLWLHLSKELLKKRTYTLPQKYTVEGGSILKLHYLDCKGFPQPDISHPVTSAQKEKSHLVPHANCRHCCPFLTDVVKQQ
jgi:hypothetical protein